MDLVVLSEVRWGYFRTRKQFLLSRFPDSALCAQARAAVETQKKKLVKP